MLYAAGNGEDQLFLTEKLRPVYLGGDASGENGYSPSVRGGETWLHLTWLHL
jgi:hypothetical protein